jgi:hypothetical protein
MVVLTIALFPCIGFAQQDPYFPSALGPPIRIVSPPNHAVFCAPVNVPIIAYTRSEATFSNVEFYANGSLLGDGILICSTTNRPVPVTGLASPDVMSADVLSRLHSVWSFAWSNAPPGSYALTAVARGVVTGGTAQYAILVNRTSAPVNITIISNTVATNLPDVVSIVATDPIAIAGTNAFWPWPGMTNAVPCWTNWPPTTWAWFTNWGPKIGLFTVYRFGSPSNDLVVNYSIGGTASNGVDYFALPGYVDIPAGYTRSLIPIVPIDHGPAAVPKTVILTLAADTNVPPDYVVGLPRRAEVLILPSWPRPLPWLLPDGTFHLNASGPDGAWFSIEASFDLLNWTPVSTNQVFQGSIDFLDPDAPNNTSRFYLTVPINNTPGD